MRHGATLITDPAQNGFLMAFWCFLKWSYDGRHVSWRYHESSQKISGRFPHVCICLYCLCIRVPSLAAKRTGSKPERDHRKEGHGKTVGPCLSFGGFWGHLYQKKNLSANPLQGCQAAAVSHRAVNSLGFKRSFWSWEKHISKSYEIMMYDPWFKDWKHLETIFWTAIYSPVQVGDNPWQSNKLRQNRPPTSSWRLLGWQDLIEETPQSQQNQSPVLTQTESVQETPGDHGPRCNLNCSLHSWLHADSLHIQAAENVCISRMLAGLMACNQCNQTSLSNCQRGHRCNNWTTIYINIHQYTTIYYNTTRPEAQCTCKHIQPLLGCRA